MSNLHQTCSQCQIVFGVSENDLSFLETISPVFNGEKCLLPSPRYCPACRQQHRMAYRNERSLYKRSCDQCKKAILSVYSPDKIFTVYCRDCWWADDWDGTDFAQDFDFDRPFFEQFYELLKKVPQLGIINALDQNSDYTNYGYQNKDCYLLFTSDFNEKCSYGCFVWSSFDCYDNLFLIDSQLCYECVDCVKCYASAYCRNSEFCFGSSGLRNKKYYFFNKPCSEEEYREKVIKAKTNWPETLKQFQEVGKDTPRRALFLVQCENVLGDHVKNSKNSAYCFDCQELEDCKYMTNTPAKSDNTQDVDGGGWLSWSYECISTKGNHHLYSDHHWMDGFNLTYCSYSMGSSNCFGCVGVKKGEYCILNKKYTEEDYETLLHRVALHMKKTGEWGDSFVPRFSRYDYNETVAQLYYPLSKDEASKLGYSWHEENMEKPEGDLENVVICEVSGKPFRLTKQELEFYKKLDLPMPKKHPEIRMKARDAIRNARKFWDRNCDKCGQVMKTTYSPDFSGKVYCESCYLATVY